MWPFGSMYTRPSPCIRKACSTQSTYSAGVRSPTMSDQLRIRVLRLRQLSATREFYEGSRVSTMDSAERIDRDIETLAGPDYTVSDEAIRRYAYTDAYRRTLDYFVRELESLGFEVEEDAVGTLVARNRPKG